MTNEQTELFVDIEGIYEDAFPNKLLTEVIWRVHGNGAPVLTYVYADITREVPTRQIAGPIKMLSDGVDKRNILSQEVAKILGITNDDYVMMSVRAEYES